VKEETLVDVVVCVAGTGMDAYGMVFNGSPRYGLFIGLLPAGF
jgi:hypothetical protein